MRFHKPQFLLLVASYISLLGLVVAAEPAGVTTSPQVTLAKRGITGRGTRLDYTAPLAIRQGENVPVQKRHEESTSPSVQLEKRALLRKKPERRAAKESTNTQKRANFNPLKIMGQRIERWRTKNTGAEAQALSGPKLSAARPQAPAVPKTSVAEAQVPSVSKLNDEEAESAWKLSVSQGGRPEHENSQKFTGTSTHFFQVLFHIC